ncbi:T9SS type A sorting domain-containing protein [Bacteroidota bacterium]
MKTHITILAIIFMVFSIISTNAFEEKASRSEIPEQFSEHEHNYQSPPGFNDINDIEDRVQMYKKQGDEIQGIDYLVDSVIVFMEVDFKFKYIYTYNESNQILTTITKKLYEDWENCYRDTYTYDEDGNQLTCLTEIWSGEWENHERKVFTYDDDGNQLTRFTDEWFGMWESDSRYTYTYDEEGNRISAFLILTFTLETVYVSNTYTYDDDGNQIIFLGERRNSGGEWIIDWRYTYTYDKNGKRIAWIRESWINDEWENHSRATYIYNENNNLITELREQWGKESEWTNHLKDTYIFNENNNLITKLREQWGKESEWEKFDKESYICNVDSKPIKYLSEKWENEGWIEHDGQYSFNDSHGNIYSYDGYLIEIYWQKITSVEKTSNSNFSITAFPNPCIDVLNISHNLPGAKIELYNTLGNKVYDVERVTGNTQNINCSNFENGVYYLRITSREKSQFERIVIMK